MITPALLRSWSACWTDERVTTYMAGRPGIAPRVPAEDRAGGDGPVTVSGWYQVQTWSGREAWAQYTWRSGRLYEDVCTYDRTAEESLAVAALADEEAVSFNRLVQDRHADEEMQ